MRGEVTVLSLFARILLLLGICFISEAAVRLFRLPVPGGVLGMALLLALLWARVVKLEHVKQISDALLSVMALFLVPSAVAILNDHQAVRGYWLPFLGVIVLSTAITLAVTGGLASLLLRKRGRHE
jgi:holin-like protein